MAASASASQVESMMAKVADECGSDISASQEDTLAYSSFLGAGNHPAGFASQDEEDDEEVFATPSDLPQQDPITMCSLPFTPSHPQSQSPVLPSDDAALVYQRWNPRVCTRKVRGAKTPTLSPEQQQQPEQQLQVDPLYRAVLMIPAAAAATASKQDPLEDFLALPCQRGIF